MLLDYDAQVTLRELLMVLKGVPEAEFAKDFLNITLRRFAAETGRTLRDTMKPLCIAVVGSDSSPGDLSFVLEVLGRDEVLARVDWPFIISGMVEWSPTPDSNRQLERF